MTHMLHYEILVRGRLGPTLLEAFPALEAQRRGDETLLSGPLADQSALYGVLHQIEALGLQLLGVSCIDAPRERERERGLH
jgi:monoterpene epsilon-lactone hydrolase